MTDRLKRGDVWLANLNPTQGSEQAGIRPVIIFQGVFGQTLTFFIGVGATAGGS
ncbi:Hypothetical Protein XM38_045750 [Halomicronema hongdechloris C2206]|uniref:Uncharacterized protein n=1 Tax=Halomicronema hongdechloris C2206 TaxID=1641165 RepID=A0A1Z3HTI1_9CYAN|nr:type II toxin-antitoxin system PemK/MazF family toxin [Halomicronema hongdechloris]ASC73604.1 Hypothetical Protein XM38_045750 [Halomicronema hongdechloris C2206]